MYKQTCLSQQNQKQKLIDCEAVKDECIWRGYMKLKLTTVDRKCELATKHTIFQ